MLGANQRGYRIFCRGLLGYLFALNLVGFSWHLHSHYDSNTVVISDEQAQFSVDDICVTCDWLVHHTYHIPSQLQTEEVAYPQYASTHFFSQNIDHHWYYQNRPARGPPTLV